MLFKLLFGDAIFVNVSGCPTLHHGFHASALLRWQLGELVGRDVWHGRHSTHRMSNGNFPQTLLYVERRDIVGGPEDQRAKDDWNKKKLVSHQNSPGVF